VSKSKRRREPGQEAAKFRTDEDTGKMIISDSDSDATTNKKTPKHSIDEQLAGAAYKDTLVSVDGFTRNPNGTIKFHKDTKKRRKEEMEMGDMEIDALEAQPKGGVGPERTKKRKEARIGQEFKAKVRNVTSQVIFANGSTAGWWGCEEEWG
jgi:ribosomal RNA-processing protein 12